jgi:hypothetical protein
MVEAAPSFRRVENQPGPANIPRNDTSAGNEHGLTAAGMNLDDPDIGLLLQKMRGKTVPQCVNTDTVDNVGLAIAMRRLPSGSERRGPLIIPPATGRLPPDAARDRPPRR